MSPMASNPRCKKLQGDYWPKFVTACENGDMETVKMLITAGADVRYRNRRVSSYTYLHLATMYGHLNVVQELIKAGANVNKVNRNGDTPLLIAVHLKYFKISTNDIIRELIKAGANVNKVNRNGDTPLLIAVHSRNLEIVNILLKAGADINATDRFNGAKAVHYAVSSVDIMKLLICAGADVETKDKLGMRPLHWACQRGRVNTVAYLVNEAKVDVNAVDDYGQGALYHTDRSSGDNRSQIIAILKSMLLHDDDRSKKYNMSSNGLLPKEKELYKACNEGRLEDVKRLIGEGVNLNFLKKDFSPTCLIVAIIGKHTDIVRELLEAGADPNKTNIEPCITPLGAAVLIENHDIVDLLLAKGANPNSPQERLDNEKLIYSATNSLPIMESLIRACANFNVTTKDGLSPLHYACQYGHIETIKYLMKAGVNVKAKDRKGRDPLWHLNESIFCEEDMKKRIAAILNGEKSPNS